MDAADLEALDPANNAGYGNARLPCGRDEEIAAFVRLIDGPEAFDEVRGALGDGHGRVLTAFAERMASLSVRTGSLTVLREGLSAAQLALALVDDYRDTLPVLSLLYRAAEILGARPKAEFRAVAALAGPVRGRLRRLEEMLRRSGRLDDSPLMAFLDRNAEDRSIAAMAFIEAQDEEGFRFQRTW